MERMQTEADELAGRAASSARGSQKSHGWGSHVIEFFAIGTGGRPDQRRARDREAGAGAPADGRRRVAHAMPDVELKPQVYKDPRPKEYFDQFHELVRSGSRRPRSTRPCASGPCCGRSSRSGRGARQRERAQRPGDPGPQPRLVHGPLLHRRVHPPAVQFMGKSQLFKGVGAWVFSHGGVFPVRRGHHDEEAFITAFKILERGGAVVMYCEGGRSRTGELGDEARPGNRAAGARVGGAGRAGGDPRLLSGAQLEAAAVPEGDGPVRRAVQVRACRGQPSREQQQEAADEIFERIEGAARRARAARRQGRAATRPASVRDRVATPRLTRPSSSIAGLAHLELLDLAGDGHRERVDELDVARDLVVGDLPAAELAHSSSVQRRRRAAARPRPSAPRRSARREPRSPGRRRSPGGCRGTPRSRAGRRSRRRG